MNSAETDLKLFWIRADQRWMSLRRQPGETYQYKPLHIFKNILILQETYTAKHLCRKIGFQNDYHGNWTDG